MFVENSLLPAWRRSLSLAIPFLVATSAFAAPPAWWEQPGSDGYPVIKPSIDDPNPNAPANVGQAKFMAKRAIERLASADPELANEIKSLLVDPQPGAGGGQIPRIVDLSVPEPMPAGWIENQQAPLLQGQLKAIATPFYDRLHVKFPVWLDGELDLNQTKDVANPTWYYPWSSTVADDASNSMATIGQLKAVFSLRFETLPEVWLDEDVDGMLDTWELANGLNPNDFGDGLADADADGIQNRYEYLLGYDPRNAATGGTPDPVKDRDGDGMPDAWEISFGYFSWDGTTHKNVIQRTLDWDVADGGGDLDADALSNLSEFQNGANPLNYDTDRDRMPDGWEVANGLNPLAAESNDDVDGDGLNNLCEFVLEFDPNSGATAGVFDIEKDRDGDGMPDWWEASFVSFVWNPDSRRYEVHAKLDWTVDDAAADVDMDGLNNGGEFQSHTNPVADDTDHDHMPDGWEMTYNLNPIDLADASEDPDADGIQNQIEYMLGFNPRSTTTNGNSDITKDRDEDGMPDAWEASFGKFVWSSELQQYFFQRVLDWELADGASDMDADGLCDLAEYLGGTDPQAVDSDGDHMGDGWEVGNTFDPTDPADALGDADGDGIKNLHEYVLEFDPRSGTTNGFEDCSKDRDGDGMPDCWEVCYILFEFDPQSDVLMMLRPLDWETADAEGDGDNDALSNLGEYESGTDPTSEDTDLDSLPDGWETNNQLNANVAVGDDGPDGDPDEDNLSNLDEFIKHTDPWNADSDGDGMEDGWEVQFGLDPNEPDEGADRDGDGVSDFDEYIAGTDPSSDSSYPGNGNPPPVAAAPAITDINTNGIRDEFETQEGLNLQTDQSSDPAYRYDFTYDLMGRLDGAADIDFIYDPEGSLESTN